MGNSTPKPFFSSFSSNIKTSMSENKRLSPDSVMATTDVMEDHNNLPSKRLKKSEASEIMNASDNAVRLLEKVFDELVDDGNNDNDNKEKETIKTSDTIQATNEIPEDTTTILTASVHSREALDDNVCNDRPKRYQRVAKKAVASLPVESSDEESPSEEEQEPSTRSKRHRKSVATFEQEARLGKDGAFFESSAEESSDDELDAESSAEESSDDELDADQDFDRNELAETKPSATRRRSNTTTPTTDCPAGPKSLSPQEKEGIVDSIKEPKDKALQYLLLNAGFQFTLLPHQFLGVRKVTGVPNDFPLHQGSKLTSPKNVTVMRALGGLNYQPNNRDNKGILVADEMVSVPQSVVVLQ
jgi:hypothetical protein